MTIEAQIARLDRSVEDFIRAVCALEDRSFTSMINRWSVRDIVAHLVGWNRYIIEGSEQIMTGELPWYDVDPGENYSKINAVVIRQYPSVNRTELVDELRASAAELMDFLRSVDAGDWDRYFGVRHGEETLTIRGTIDDLIADYVHHRRQITDQAAAAPG